ncbi:MAG TPA: hypothetical protein DCK99_04945 [Blastocatellia bacterium]|nr:hypothetical protein [Blastocatellia bacterium]
MDALPHLSSCRERGAALVIVLAFVVLLTGLVVAYLSRTTSDRQVAHVSFNQTKVDQVAASGMDLIIGGLRQEITGPPPTPTPPYLPATNANMLPLRSGNPSGVPDPIPNLVRRSVQADPILPPGVSSLASTLNSTTDVSANGRFISLPRWNKHYLVPKLNTGDDKTDPVASFVAPDWVILTRGGPVAFSTWNSALADQTATNNSYAVGRYAYAVYDEGGLLDANVAGYPSGTTADQSGRKGPVAFADLTALPYPIPNSSSPYQIDRLVGWRNYGSTQPSNNFPDTAPAFAANFRAGPGPALAYWNSIINNTPGFTSARSNPSPPPYPWNGRTDQMFLSRQELLAFRAATQFSANALQYLGTFLRELNAPSWKPSTPAGSTIDYATLANTPTSSTSTAINRDLLAVRAIGAFTRADGTTTAVGDLLIKRRFPLSRINGLADPTFPVTAGNSTIVNGFLVPASATTVQRDFGLQWDGANTAKHWNYVGATGSTVQTAIKRLDQVAAENREPNFFELLKAVILNGSVGLGSGTGNVRTFVNAETKYYSNPLSSDYQIMQIGANIIDQWDSDNVPTFINFNDTTGNYELAGTENLPYLNKLVFKPLWKTVAGKAQFAAWLLPSLWNPHQNAPPLVSQNVRLAITAGTMTASLIYTGSPGGTLTTTTPIGASNGYMTVDAKLFGTSPSAPAAVINTLTGSSITQTPDNLYYGFNFPFATSTSPLVTSSNSSTAYPDFGAAPGCNFEMQVQVSTSPVVWKAYQKWTGCGPLHPLIFQPPASSWTLTTLQDPEFVTLDPRTLRFGAWGNAGNQSLVATDYTSGVLTTLEPSTGVFEKITALPPNGTRFSSPTSTDLYKYANNVDTTVHYTDLDGPPLQRQGDLLASGDTAMLPTDTADRPQILNRPFQSVAELGQVFRDQPWKTLDFFMTAASPDAGLIDIFTLHESSMEAGKTSFNTRQKPILTAILSQATKRLTDPTGATVITSAQRDSIVNALFALQPMVRKTELLTQLASNATVIGLGNKEARELVIRAFSDACQTRTWNLMIDVVAQSGRYPPNASTLAGFLVEGEQHYWVHVAIDRFTGQVIDKQIEVVNE